MSSINVWDMVAKEYSAYPEDFSGVFDRLDCINEAQKKLGVKFSDAYVKFATEFGSADIGACTIFCFGHLPSMGNDTGDIIENTQFYRNQKWPDIDNWYIISDDGLGNPIGVDPEGKVWLSDHDAGFEHIKLADSFEEFIYCLLTDTLYEQDSKKGTVEKYNKTGKKHYGDFDPNTGVQVTPPDPSRRVKK